MKRRTPGVLIRGLLVAASLTACAGPLGRAPKPVQAALDPFVSAGFVCAEPSTDHSAFMQWQCDRQSSDGVHFSIFLDADDSGIKQVMAVVDQSNASATKREVALDFFGEVSDINLGGTSKTLRSWVETHATDGGQEQVGPILVTLDRLQPVDHLVAFVVG